MLQDIRYPYVGNLDSESLHKFSERVFNSLTKTYRARPTEPGRKFVFTLDPLQDGSGQQDMVIRTDVFDTLVPGGREIVLPKKGEEVLLAGRICPTFKIHEKRDKPILDWLQKRQLLNAAGSIVELQHQQTTHRPRHAGRSGGTVPEALVYFKLLVNDCSAFYILLRRGIGDNRAYGLGFLLNI